jgi:hypothetical protein
VLWWASENQSLTRLTQPSKLYILVGTTIKNAVTVDTTNKIVYRGWLNQQNAETWLAQPSKML